MKLRSITESLVPLRSRLLHLRPLLAAAAQSVYNEWSPNEEGLDDVYGGGGICDEISNRMGDVLTNHDVEYTLGGQDGDDHAYLIAYDQASAFSVDIPPSYYETGGGMSWTKIPDIQITPEMVEIAETWRPDWIDEEDILR